MLRRLLSLLCALTLSATVRAQLVYTAPYQDMPYQTNAWAAWHRDLATGVDTPLWRNHVNDGGVLGIAADEANGKIYCADSQLFVWTYGSPNPPVLLGLLHEAPNGNFMVVVDLAWAQGLLYGIKRFGLGSNLGIYEIPVNPVPAFPQANLVLAIPNTYAFDAFTYDAASGLFFAAQNGSNFTRGLYTIDALGSGAIQLVAPYPAGWSDVHGLALANGRLYFTPSLPGPVHVYDVALAQYLADLANVPTYAATALASCGATWAPSLAASLAAPASFCAPDGSGNGCLPLWSTSGTPSASASSGFLAQAQPFRNNRWGQLIYTIGGARGSMLLSGFSVCMSGQLLRGPTAYVGGNPAPVDDCSGAISLDLNAFASGALGGNPSPALTTPGTTVRCIFRARDTVNVYQTTNTLEYMVGP